MNARLLDAIVQPEPSAVVAWHDWRRKLSSFDALAYPELVALPLLGTRLLTWTDDDPEAARFRGILRLAWTRMQVQLQAVMTLERTLAEAGLIVAVCGPTALALRADREGAVRTIPHFDLFVTRQNVADALACLSRDGWLGADWRPDANALDWRRDVRLRKRADVLYLTWRTSPAIFHRARQAEDRAANRLQPLSWNGHVFSALDPIDELVRRVTTERAEDPVPIDADLTSLSLPSLDWDRVRAEVREDGLAPGSPNPLARLREMLRRWPHLAIPTFANGECVNRHYRPDWLWNEYRRQCMYLNRPVTLRHFAAYLSGGARREIRRWQQRRRWL